jgi:predicted ATPase/DNA-binding XRE family transcriptional regulator
MRYNIYKYSCNHPALLRTYRGKAVMDIPDSFGYWVKRQRKALDLTQEELAARVGCAAVTLRKIEADERRPSCQMAKRLADCLALPSGEVPMFLAVAARQRTPASMKLPGAPILPDRLPTKIPGNLPAPISSLVGRDAELNAIIGCLRRKAVRLHTLTGPVGVGKTRLAIEAGLRLRPEYRDGVFWVTLDTLQDPEGLPALTASVLGVHEGWGQSLAQSFASYLANKEMLLIFDNFEHLLPAADFLSGLLAAAPRLCLLVTSRARLQVYGEHEFVVPPLAMPEDDNLDDAAQTASLRLFCDRAQAAWAGFRLTPENLPAVAQVCRRLDGLPLAIELAAAHIKLFSPQELLQRLEHRLSLLSPANTGGLQPTQGLEQAIAWSYSLLSPAERKLMERLAVFVGVFSLSSAEAVCAFPFSEPATSTGLVFSVPPNSVAEGLAALLDHSLLQRQEQSGAAGGCSRFKMLEIVREFALARLQANAELNLIQQRHCQFFVDWAARAETYLYGPDQAAWLTEMANNIDDMRAALSWSLQTGQVEMAARLACAAGTFWRRRGHYSEGRSRFDLMLTYLPPGCVPDALRAKLLQVAGSLAYRQGDWHTAKQWLDESLALLRACHDQLGVARVLFDLGWIALDQGKWGEAARLNTESLALARAGDDRLGMYRALTNLGWTKLCISERDEAEAFFHEAHHIAVDMGHTKGVAVTLANLSWIAIYQGDMPSAAAQAAESLRLCYLLGEREVMAECLELLAIAAVGDGDHQHAARLLGAAQALWDALHVVRPPSHHSSSVRDQALETLRQQLPDEVFSAAWLQGSAMSLDALVQS